jgi:hypothetical protein
MAFKDLFKKKDKKAAPAADKSFGETFKAERKKQGPDGTFTWKGKKYTTKFKEEVGLKKSPVPKPRPAKPTEPVAKTPPPAPKAKDDGPSVATQACRTAGGIGAGAGLLAEKHIADLKVAAQDYRFQSQVLHQQ